MYNFFADYNEKFFGLINKKFDWSGSLPSFTDIQPIEFSLPPRIENLDETSQGCIEGTTRKLPSLMVLGLNELNIRTLSVLLKLNPFLAVVENSNFFSDRLIYDKTPLDYLLTLPCVGKNVLVVETSTSYLQDEKAIERIYRFNTNVKIVGLLTDPVRSLLAYTSPSQKDLDTFNYETRHLHYYNYVKEWYVWFQKKNLAFISVSSILKAPVKRLNYIESILKTNYIIKDNNDLYNAIGSVGCNPEAESNRWCNNKQDTFSRTTVTIKDTLYKHFEMSNTKLFELTKASFRVEWKNDNPFR